MEEKEMMENVKSTVNNIIANCISNDEMTMDDIEKLGELIDINKDLANIEYWKFKEENVDMYYGNYGRDEYGNYGARRRRDSRGRYMESGRGSYGRRYRGHDMIDDVSDNYGTYMEGKEESRRGNYGAKEDSMKSLEYMLQSVEDFMMMLSEEADSQEEVEMIKRTARKISDM